MEKLFKPKLLSILQKGYSIKQLNQDVFAGVIVGIVALPLAIAFAVASGVSPEKGIITAVIAGFIISFFGGSRVQIGGPTGAFIVIVYGIVAEYGFNGLLISTLMAGFILILFGLFRMGSVLKFIPHPLIVGFTSGIAIIILTSQVKDAFGLNIAEMPASFTDKIKAYSDNILSLNFPAFLLTGLSILITLYSKKIIKVIPGSFIAILVVTAIVSLFSLQVDTIGSIYGEISGKINFILPLLNISELKDYIQPAFTIAILGAIESLLSAVVADGMIGGNHRSNTELIAQGIANIVTPFFGGIPATGAIARTATNVKNGGRTPVSGMVHAVVLLLIMLLLGKWASLIPLSCLAGILIVVAYNMSEWRSFLSILKGTPYDVLILLSTFFLTIFVDLTIAIEIGLVLSAFLFMQRMAKVSNVFPVENDSDILENYSEIPKEISIYEISGPFFFGAAKKYKEVLKNIQNGKSRILIIRMRHVPFIDSTGLANFRETIHDLQAGRCKIILSGVQPEVRKELEKGRIAFMIGKANISSNFDEALNIAVRILTAQKKNNNAE